MSRVFYVARGSFDARPLGPDRTTAEAAHADLVAIIKTHPSATVCALEKWED